MFDRGISVRWNVIGTDTADAPIAACSVRYRKPPRLCFRLVIRVLVRRRRPRREAVRVSAA